MIVRFAIRTVEGIQPVRFVEPREPCRRRRRAFTLVELMVVVVILGLLAGVATLSVRSYLVAAKRNVAKMEISKICQALDTFYTAHDRYPTNEEGLDALLQSSEQFPDGLLNNLTNDPWGNLYEYIQPGRNAPFEVISYGADGREGGEDADKDISSAQMETE